VRAQIAGDLLPGANGETRERLTTASSRMPAVSAPASIIHST
jgi:hypothetical protein